MRLIGWIRRHRALTAFAGGVFLTLVALAVVGYVILSDQRRSARVLAAALSRILAREVRIDRVTDVGTQRVVMRGVELPRRGGWPATVVADTVEATGPLLAAARGDAAPVRLSVRQPAVDVPAGGSAGLAALEGLRQGIAGFLAGPLLLDVTLTGGTVRHAGGTTEFDLVLRKGRGEAHGELTLRELPATPLVLTVGGRLEGDTARLVVAGRGALAPLAGWLGPAPAAVLRGRALELHLDVDLSAAQAMAARGSVTAGDLMAASGTATLERGRLEVALPHASADLAFAAAVAGLGWTPTGRAELSGVTATWRPDAGPTIRAALHLPAGMVPAAGLGTEVSVAELEGDLVLERARSGLALEGRARAARVRAAGVEIAPVETRYRLSLGVDGTMARADLDDLEVSVEGAALRGSLGYDAGARRLDARLEGGEVEAGALIRRLAPGWLEPTDRVRLTGLRVTAAGLDPIDFRRGTARLEARGLAWPRAGGALSGGRLGAGIDFGRDRVALALDAEHVVSALSMLPGEIPRLAGSAELARRPDGGLRPERAAVTARDRAGRELVVATLQPAPANGRLRVSARVPALERLDGFWPAVPRRVNGSARLDVELRGLGFKAADGRLGLTVPEAELWGGKVSIRDLEADVPLRRGSEIPGEPSWGKVAIGELIGYGIVARDLTTPARVWNDRLSLNELAYALYSGDGKGWSEIELEPAGLAVRGKLTGAGVRIEEFMSAYGIRGGTMTGLLRYDLDYQYRAAHLGVKGRFEVPAGGTVSIELLDRLLGYAEYDPTGVLRRALESLRAFDYKWAEADVASAGGDIRASLTLRGRERFLFLPPKVREITIRNLPLSFLARQFPGSFN